MSEERIVVLGSGPAAAGVCLALLAAGHRDILVLDLGGELSEDKKHVVERMAAQPAASWRSDDVEAISQQPVVTSDGLPQKRSFGSGFPFRNLGQLDDVAALAGANDSAVSSAYGGFSNVWGAQIMPFSKSTFDTWPIAWQRIAPHYEAVLGEVPLAAERDDLLHTFPLLTEHAQPLPKLSARSSDVLARYAQHRSRLRSSGITLGRARLALRANQCVTCGLCMTGCPYHLIYSASQTFDRLRRDGSVRYEPGVLVTRVGEDADGCVVTTRNIVTGTQRAVRADRVFVACGGIGSTRLALGSLERGPDEVTMSESLQFAVPFLSRRSAGDPRREPTFTLNQFNMLVSFDEANYHTSHIHCYPYNPSVLTALPLPLRGAVLNPVTAQILSRLTIGLGYLPSWASPAVRLQARRRADALPELTIGATADEAAPLMLKQVMRRLKRAAPSLDLYPVEAMTRLAAPAKSYHFGGSFPHRAVGSDGPGSDDLGRPASWRRIHLVDGAVLPSVPSTTFTLTVMANAHRIATEAVAAS